jgi:hypothetical protein
MMSLKVTDISELVWPSRVPQSTLHKLTSQTYALKNLLALLFKHHLQFVLDHLTTLRNDLSLRTNDI